MKTIIFILVAIFISSLNITKAGEPASDEYKGISFFDGSWEDALKLAKKENKLIFLDVYATWCGPCRRLSSLTFPDPEVGKYFNERFINVKIDGEKGEGPMIRQRYQVRGYPTLLFINHKGEVIHRTSGFRDPERFLELGRSVAAN